MTDEEYEKHIKSHPEYSKWLNHPDYLPYMMECHRNRRSQAEAAGKTYEEYWEEQTRPFLETTKYGS